MMPFVLSAASRPSDVAAEGSAGCERWTRMLGNVQCFSSVVVHQTPPLAYPGADTGRSGSITCTVAHCYFVAR